eukprot:Seg1020.1 transcript_id=Seg1020.1/GoldUCD/mRNA.D3Y31 product="hypothetical protein" protein_id=Seg1020.1/GoldUCD/D3Y31
MSLQVSFIWGFLLLIPFSFANDDCKPSALPFVNQQTSAEVTVTAMTQEINGSQQVAQSSRVIRKVDLPSDAKMTTLQPYVNVRFNGLQLCIGVKFVMLRNTKPTKFICHRRCLLFKKFISESILVRQENFEENSNRTLKTFMRFTVKETAPRCAFCIGQEDCVPGQTQTKQCNHGDKCYYMTVRDDVNDPNAFPTMGCNSDILFRRLDPAECWNGCKQHVKYGKWDRYACTFCCANDLCNDEILAQKIAEEKARINSKNASTTVRSKKQYFVMYVCLVMVFIIKL